MTLIVGALQAQNDNKAQLVVSSHQACIGDAIRFDDATSNDKITSRYWIFEDTTIIGSYAGDQITVIRSFAKEYNPVELRLICTTYDTTTAISNDTVYGTHNDTITSSTGEDSVIVVPDTTITLAGATIISITNDTLSAFDTVHMFVHPKMQATGDTIICEGNETNIKMDPVMNAVTYNWFETPFDDGSPIAYGSRLQVEPYSANATYYLKILNNMGCVSWDSIKVYVMQPSLTVQPADGNICAGDPAYLIAGKADHYLWESIPQDTTLAGQESNSRIEVSPKSTTVYALTPYGNNGCSSEKIYVTITVHQLPSLAVKIMPAVIDPTNPTITLTDESANSVSSFWSFGLNNFAEGTSVTHTFTDLNKDSASVILQSSNDLGCSADTSFRIAIQSFALWVPNIFCPNRADNSKFHIYTVNKLEYFSIQIFNRRGLMVFESEDPQFVWDGSYNEQYCPQGAYVYVCNYRLAGTDHVDQTTGTVTLIR